MEAVTNATVLILLAKIDRLNLLEVIKKIQTTPEIEREVLEGKNISVQEKERLGNFFKKLRITRTRHSLVSQSQQAAGYYPLAIRRVRGITKLGHSKPVGIRPNFEIEIAVHTLQLDLGEGEKSAISLCKQENILLFLSDDKKARKTANILGIKTLGTIGILLKNLQEKRIAKKEAKEILTMLLHHSYYISTDLYVKTIEIIDMA